MKCVHIAKKDAHITMKCVKIAGKGAKILSSRMDWGPAQEEKLIEPLMIGLAKLAYAVL
jgi:hypothetical protein